MNNFVFATASNVTHMKGSYEKEAECLKCFESLGEAYHLWTQENFEVIFTCDDDFKLGMGIFGIVAKLYGDVRILTFELMSNHIHVAAVGRRERIIGLFLSLHKSLASVFSQKGRKIDWKNLHHGIRRIENLGDLRNVIVYINRNGFLVNPEHSPYTYPWGANSFYFNPAAKRLSLEGARKVSFQERRNLIRSHKGDSVDNLLISDGYATALSFCDITTGESLFRDASHYFVKLSKNIETNRLIAQEIGESIYYNDEELYSALVKISLEKFNAPDPKTVDAQGKIQLAGILHYDYNASNKQISRFLKLDPSVLQAIFKE